MTHDTVRRAPARNPAPAGGARLAWHPAHPRLAVHPVHPVARPARAEPGHAGPGLARPAR